MEGGIPLVRRSAAMLWASEYAAGRAMGIVGLYAGGLLLEGGPTDARFADGAMWMGALKMWAEGGVGQGGAHVLQESCGEYHRGMG